MRADGRDEWKTPAIVYNRICQHWNVVPQVDLFASEFDTKCKWFITEEQNSFTVNWSDTYMTGWMNPPYSEPILTMAVEKAVEQAFQGFQTVFLLPNFTDRPWFNKYIKHFEHDFWPGRIKFEAPEWIVPSSPRYGNVHGVIRL